MKLELLDTEEQTDSRGHLGLLGWWVFLVPRVKKADQENPDWMVFRG